jgi:adenine-specific DNA-methyltransferase
VLARETEIAQLIDFGDASVFTAIAYPSIIVAEKHVPAEDHQLLALNWNPNTPLSQFTQEIERARAQIARPGPNAPLVLQKRLTPDGWRLEGEATQRLLDKLRRAGRPLGDYVGGRFYRGVLTGLNEAFVVDRATRDRLIAEHPSSAELLKPYLRGRDVKRWRVENPDLWLIFTRRGTNIDSYPAIKQHLSAFKDALMPGTGRKPGSYEWYEIQDNVAYWQEFEQPKIIYPDIYEHQSFSYDIKSFFTGNTCYFIPTQELWLLGLLNSKTIEWFYSLISNRIRGGYLRAFSDYMTRLPIPISSSTTAIDDLVERIVAAKQQDAKANVTAWEEEINQRVYALYGLRSDEIRQIEETVGAAGASDEQQGDEQ